MSYLPRLVDTKLADILTVFPAALVLGPRAVGKTTTARRHAVTIVELDDPPQAGPFRADPSAALRTVLRRNAGQGPVLLDEWQQVPQVLGAVKRMVDQGAPAGSLLLTGSVRAPLSSASWAGTGRVIHLDMYPVTVLEQHASQPPRSKFVEQLFAGDLTELALPPELPDLPGYAELAVTGGYPPTIGLEEPDRRIWLGSYVDQLVLRDVPELGEIRDPSGLRRLLRAVIESTAGITADTELAAKST